MGGEDLVQRLTADESRSGKVVANVIYQVVGLLIHVLFANREHMSEVALDKSLDCVFALNAPQVPYAGDDQCGCRERHGKLQGEHQTGPLIPKPF